jgi:nucleotide-binding universal stress UspA family protein
MCNLITLNSKQTYMEKILVPVDFSDNSIKAVMYAAAIAIETSARLHLLHVTQPPAISYSDLPLPDPRISEDLISEGCSRMEHLKTELLKQEPSLDILYNVLEGEVTITINDFVKEEGCDMIVMGTHGASGFKGFIWSSLTAKTMMHSTVPVIAVPAQYQLSDTHKILLATNRFEENNALIEPVFQLSKIFHAAVDVVVFIDKDTASGYEYIEAGKHLDRYQSFLQKKYPAATINAELIDGSNFENAMALYESREEIDLIAMITYPKGIYEKLARKTFTKKVTLHSGIPVLAIPAGLALEVK